VEKASNFCAGSGFEIAQDKRNTISRGKPVNLFMERALKWAPALQTLSIMRVSPHGNLHAAPFHAFTANRAGSGAHCIAAESLALRKPSWA
jgi:hypothetical protein